MQVGVRELKAKTSDVLRRVEHGEIIEITNHGRVVARLVPALPPAQHDEALAVLADMEQLAAEIGARDLEPVDTAMLIHEERRAL
jgi:prevent-host-death family protein